MLLDFFSSLVSFRVRPQNASRNLSNKALPIFQHKGRRCALVRTAHATRVAKRLGKMPSLFCAPTNYVSLSVLLVSVFTFAEILLNFATINLLFIADFSRSTLQSVLNGVVSPYMNQPSNV